MNMNKKTNDGVYTIVFVNRHTGNADVVADFYNKDEAIAALDKLSSTVELADRPFGEFKMSSFENGKNSVYESRLRRGRIMEDVNWSKNDSKVAMEEMKAGLENALGIKFKRGSADSFSTTYENKDNEVDIEVFREPDDEGELYRAFVDVNFFVGNQDVFNFFEEIPNDPRERKSLVREVVKQIKKPRYPDYVRGVH